MCKNLAPGFRDLVSPTVVDLGFGASGVTSAELYSRVQKVNSSTRVLGIEIDPERVAAAQSLAQENLQFLRGGFEVPIPKGWNKPSIIRAANVLRQYPEAQVPAAWELMCSRLGTGGVLLEGTCDELGRRGCWITLDAKGPKWFTLLFSVQHLERPSQIADRLPKVLIHRNLPGNNIYNFLQQLDKCWDEAAVWSSYGPKQRWLATVAKISEQPKFKTSIVRFGSHFYPGELTVRWEIVAP